MSLNSKLKEYVDEAIQAHLAYMTDRLSAAEQTITTLIDRLDEAEKKLKDAEAKITVLRECGKAGSKVANIAELVECILQHLSPRDIVANAMFASRKIRETVLGSKILSEKCFLLPIGPVPMPLSTRQLDCNSDLFDQSFGDLQIYMSYSLHRSAIHVWMTFDDINWTQDDLDFNFQDTIQSHMFLTKPVMPIRLTVQYTKWDNTTPVWSSLYATAKVLVKHCTCGELCRVAAELIMSEPASWSGPGAGGAILDDLWSPRSITSLIGPDEEAVDLMLSVPEYRLSAPSESDEESVWSEDDSWT